MENNVKSLPPHLTVIDADTLQVSYEQAKPSMLLADAERKHAAVVLLEIDCPEMYAEGVELLSKIVGAKKDLDEQRKATGKPLRSALENINSGYNPAINRLEEAEVLAKRLLTKYIDDQAEKERVARVEAERLQREEQDRQRRVAAEAQRLATEEAARTREAAEAAQRLVDAEATKKREAAAETKRLADVETARLNLEAEAALAAGNAEAAEAAKALAESTQAAATITAAALEQEASASQQAAQENTQQAAQQSTSILQAANENTIAVEQVALMSTAVVVPLSAPKVSGLSKSTKFTVAVTDPVAFLRFIADNYATMSFYVDFNQAKLNGMAQAQKTAFKLPGCVASGATQLASRRA